MANSIVLAQSYLNIMDEIYKAQSKTSILDNTNVQFVNANTIKFYKMTMDGLASYGRNSGFVKGDVNGTWETHTLAVDRGIELTVDSMDNEETIGQAFGKLVGEFTRTQTVPEVDAYTFAKIAGTTGIQKATAADISIGTTDVAALIDEAEFALNDAEVPEEGRILFLSEATYAAMRSKIVREIMNGESALSNAVESYNGMRIVRVPQARFYTTVQLNDGSTATGYTKGTGAKKINFILLHPSAVMKCMKHATARIFEPGVNQDADAWKFQTRLYHDTFVYENKLKGVYLHAGAANA